MVDSTLIDPSKRTASACATFPARDLEIAALAASGIEIDTETNAPRWDGTAPDYALCIEALSFADGLHQ